MRNLAFYAFNQHSANIMDRISEKLNRREICNQLRVNCRVSIDVNFVAQVPALTNIFYNHNRGIAYYHCSTTMLATNFKDVAPQNP